MCEANEPYEETNYRCGMCDECMQESRNEKNKQKEETTSCKNCGWCEECCD